MSHLAFALTLYTVLCGIAWLLPNRHITDHQHTYTDPDYLGVGATFDCCLICGEQR